MVIRKLWELEYPHPKLSMPKFLDLSEYVTLKDHDYFEDVIMVINLNYAGESNLIT